MSKKHQYLVRSRDGQTAVHKKERRKVAQSLGQVAAAPLLPEWKRKSLERKRRRMVRYVDQNAREIVDDTDSGRLPVMQCRTGQSLGLPRLPESEDDAASA